MVANQVEWVTPVSPLQIAHPRAEGEHRQRHLDDQGIAQPHGTGDRASEAGKRLRCDDVGIHELPDHSQDALVNHDLRQEQDRDGHEKASVNREVVDEPDRDGVARGKALVGRQQQQGQPGDRRDANHSAHEELEMGPGQEQAAPRLIEGPTEHERKVLQIRARSVRCHRRSPPR